MGISFTGFAHSTYVLDAILLGIALFVLLVWSVFVNCSIHVLMLQHLGALIKQQLRLFV